MEVEVEENVDRIRILKNNDISYDSLLIHTDFEEPISVYGDDMEIKGSGNVYYCELTSLKYIHNRFLSKRIKNIDIHLSPSPGSKRRRLKFQLINYKNMKKNLSENELINGK